MDAGTHDGWEETCWDGFVQSIDLIAQKRIKVIVNGGALNPAGLAAKVQDLVSHFLFSTCFASFSCENRAGTLTGGLTNICRLIKKGTLWWFRI
jgi:hypothetical protein